MARVWILFSKRIYIYIYSYTYNRSKKCATLNIHIISITYDFLTIKQKKKLINALFNCSRKEQLRNIC